MSHAGTPVIGRRRIPGTPRSFSEVTISVDPPAVAPPSVDARVAALLRRAREFGVTTFDVAAARFPPRAERLIATAFPSVDPDLAVIVGRSLEVLAKGRTHSGEARSSRDPESALEESLEESRHRLAPAPVSVVEWTPETGRDEGLPRALAGPSPVGANPEGPLWALRLSASLASWPPPGPSPALLSGGFSLLDLGVLSLMEASTEKPGAHLIARDVFSDGRLDGSRFGAPGVLGDPGAPPVDLRRLHEEFDPILRLGFLTAGHRRTLAQAALQFALAWPWVSTAVIPLPAPENLDTVLAFNSRPPLTDDELSRLRLVK